MHTAVWVNELTGFVWKKADLRKKKFVFKNIRIRVAGASVSHTKIIMKLSACLHEKTRTGASFIPG